jgi:DNA-binding beta-propeller fold protein YncE
VALLAVTVIAATVVGTLVLLDVFRGEEGNRPSSTSSRPPVTQGDVERIPVPAPQPIVADQHAVWVVAGASGRNVLWRIDTETNEATELPGTRGAEWPAVGEGFAWVTCHGTGNPCGGNSVLRLNAGTGAIDAAIPMPGYPGQITAGLGAVWVSTGAGLVKIDPDSATVAATFPVRTNLIGTSGGLVWATASGSAANPVIAIDPSEGRVVRQVDFDDPCLMFVTPEAIWVSSCMAGLAGSPPDTLARIDPSTAEVVSEVPTVQGSGSMAVLAGRLWMARWSGHHVEIQELDPENGTPADTTLTVTPGDRPWMQIGVGRVLVFMAAGDDSFWLTHVDADQVVRVLVTAG